MTKKDLSQLDPDAQRPLLLIRRLTVALIGAVFLLGAVVTIVGLRGESTRKIITKSACATDPDGAECQTIKRESDEARPAADFCIGAEKIDRGGRLMALTRCRELERRQVRIADGDASSPAPVVSGGGDSSPAAEGGDAEAGAPHGPGEHDHHPAPTQVDGDPAPTARAEPDPVEQPATSSEPTSPGQSAADPGTSGLVKPALEGIGSTAQDTVDAVPPVVCAATSVLHPCPK